MFNRRGFYAVCMKPFRRPVIRPRPPAIWKIAAALNVCLIKTSLNLPPLSKGSLIFLC